MKKSTTTSSLFFLGTAALVAVLNTGAHAADVPQVHVKYADLDINSAAGAAALYQRIRFAANQVCGTSDQRELSRLVAAKACAEKTVADTVQAANMGSLSAVYEAMTAKDAIIKLASR